MINLVLTYIYNNRLIEKMGLTKDMSVTEIRYRFRNNYKKGYLADFCKEKKIVLTDKDVIDLVVNIQSRL